MDGDPDQNSHKGDWNVNAEYLLRPVTVRQMLDAKPAYTGANLVINGNEVVNVTTVAHLAKLAVYETKYDFSLEDGTRGRITARQWRSDDPGDDSDVNNIVAHTYVRVVGTLVRFGGHNHLRVIKIRKAVDYHELCFHLLDVMVTTLTHERGPPPRDIARTSTSISQHESAQADEPNASQTDHEGMFNTPFAMHAMRESLPTSSLPFTASALASAAQSPFSQDAPIDSAGSQSAQLYSLTGRDVSAPEDLGSSFDLPKKDKGKARPDGGASSGLPSSGVFQHKPSYSSTLPSVNVASTSSTSNVDEASDSLTTSPTGFTPVDIARLPSSLQPNRKIKVTESSPYAAGATHEPEPSTAKDVLPPPRSFPIYSSSPSERQLEPYADVNALERRIISVILDTMETEYEGVHVEDIMNGLMVEDENITPHVVDDAISSLISEGYLYTTVDELHFKVTPSP